ncbi:helicase associated domain-containing protein [Streptomyces sp. NPDC059224]|uniref:helicase associated domain-containing protein n=1 Tax=Streptomyces sp. NPDC059224 TaxID=3346775 RepID=UPI003695D1C3
MSERAAGVLRLLGERDPAVVAQFVRLAVIDSGGTCWRRGIEAATRWRLETGGPELRVPYTFVTPAYWQGIGNHPLGVRAADERRSCAAGTLQPERVAGLRALGVVWPVHDTAWEEGLIVARAYAAASGWMPLPPTSAVWKGCPIGTWVENQRAAARKARENTERRAAGETVFYAGELPQDRLGACTRSIQGVPLLGRRPATLLLCLAHADVKAGGTLSAPADQVIVQGEELGAWAAAQRHGWDRLLPAQQWLPSNALGVEPAAGEKRSAGRSRSTAWARNIAAARQFGPARGI